MTRSSHRRLLLRGSALAICAGAALAATTAQAQAQTGPTNLVSACSGVSLPRSVVTDILRPVANGIVAPVQNTVNPILGVVGGLLPLVPPLNIDTTTLLNDAASGAPIRLQVLNTSGAVVGTTDRCDTQADSFSLRNPAGIAIGGNRITGLGSTGLEALAGEANSIAFGNSARTDALAGGSIAIGNLAAVNGAATGAVALGNGAQGNAANGVALGAGSIESRGAVFGYAALGLAAPQASAGAVSIGAAGAERQLTNVAAGSAPTDAVNVAQLQGVAAQVAAIPADLVRYDTAAHDRVTLSGAAGTVVTNVAPGVVAAGSTDAVNGDQLFAASTGAQTTITNLTNNITNGGIGTVQYANPATPTVPNGGTRTDELTLVGASGTAVGLHNVRDGVVAAGSTDAVNGNQLAATNTGVTNNTTAITNLTTNVNNGAVGPWRYSNAGSPAVPNGGTITNDVAVVGAVAGPVGVHNVAAGVLNAASTDAVNGSQLFATNTNVTNNTTAINTTNTALTNLTTNINNGAVGPLRYADPATGLPNGGVPTNAVALVGGAAGPVTVNNVARGAVNAGSAQAVNGAQLFEVANQVAAINDGAVTYDDGSRNRVTLRGPAGTVLANVAAGNLAAGSTEAVNGSQLYATNQTITNIVNNIGNGAVGTVQYANAATPTTPNGGVPSDELTLVSASGGPAGLHNVRDGVVATGSTDAVNGGQLAAVASQVNNVAANAVSYDDASRTRVTLGGAGAPAVALTNVAAGSVAAGSTDAVNGDQLFATNANVANNTTAITNLTTTVNNNSTAITNLNTTVAGNTTAISNLTTTVNNNSTAIANNSTAITNLTNNVNNGAVGPVRYSNPGSPATPNGGTITNDVALVGAAAGPVGLHNVADGRIGAGSTDAVNGGQVYQLASAAANAVTYDTDAGGNRTNTVTLAGGTAGAPVRLTNVAGGTVSAASSDAVNGAQLHATNQAVAGAQGTANTALALGRNSVQYDAGTTSVTFGPGAAAITLKNVAAGVAGTDAVNVAQMNAGLNNAVTQANNYTDSRIAALNYDVKSMRRNADAGTSSALAAAGLPQAYEAGRGMIALGGGVYGAEQAVALGASKAFNDGRTVAKLGGSLDSAGRVGASGGIGYQF